MYTRRIDLLRKRGRGRQQKAPYSRRGPSFIPTVEPVLKTGAHVDRVALFERHIGLLDVLAGAQRTTEELHLAPGDRRVTTLTRPPRKTL